MGHLLVEMMDKLKAEIIVVMRAVSKVEKMAVSRVV